MSKRPLRILSIDDDQGCLLAAAKFFTIMGGHMVEAAENGKEGIEKATRIRPDIILLDMSMPDMTGLEVMDALCADAATRDIPVILITGGSLSDTERDSIRAKRNFMGLEQKPADFSRLLEEIEAALQPDTLSLGRRKEFSGDSLEPA